MSRLIVLTAMTVDGVMTVEEWFVPEGDHMEASLRLFEGDTALLYGRKNYEGLAAYWMAAEGEWADLLNPMRSPSGPARDKARRRSPPRLRRSRLGPSPRQGTCSHHDRSVRRLARKSLAVPASSRVPPIECRPGQAKRGAPSLV